LENPVSFPSFLSPEIQNLISGLLEKNPEDRTSIKDALKHDWFVVNGIIKPG